MYNSVSPLLLDVPSREGLLEKVYECLEKNIPLDTIHIPHSDVFFVREALEARFKCTLSIEQTEEYMKEAGWYEHTRKSEEQDEGTWSEWGEQTQEDSFT